MSKFIEYARGYIWLRNRKKTVIGKELNNESAWENTGKTNASPKCASVCLCGSLRSRNRVRKVVPPAGALRPRLDNEGS